ncbi:MAG: molybdopterin molybdotransferase MoeA [Euryarchaeota archaeon]|nr:molybdopterin molybdotransferase MoeA [Euryarchaeota archaeon]
MGDEMRKLVPLDEAHALIDGLRKKFYFNREVETVSVEDVLGRELAEDIVAAEESPKYNFASYDGYAVRSEDCESYPLRIVHRTYAGDEKEDIPALNKGEAIAIATGAYLPEGADAVLRLEDARVEGNLLYGIPIKKWTKVVKAGSNYEKGDVVLRKFQRLRPQEIGVLHDMGVDRVKVFKKPRVAVFSTGDEVHKGLLRDTNSPMIVAFLKEWGCDAKFLGTIPDDLEATKQKFIEGSEYDATITSGGVSVGEKDYVLRAIEELGELLLHKVKTRPGKPLAVGIINGKPVFGLPGKPTGAFVAAELNLRRYFLGSAARPVFVSKIGEDIKLSTKDTDAADIANIVFVHRSNGIAYPVGFENSPMKLIRPGEFYNVSTIASSLRAANADGYVIAVRDLKKGETVEVNLF